jgi:perosamine synthetase
VISLYGVQIPESSVENLQEVFRSKRLADGDTVRAFEEKLGSYIGSKYVTTTSSASGGVLLALYIAGVRPGDEVLATPMACLATNMPILNLFAKVVWCDIDKKTGNFDPAEIEKRITPKTKALVYAPWAGNVADVDSINRLCKKYNIALIEDASEGLAAEYKGRKLGNNTADFTIFSFYPNKLVTTGEGGAISFRNPEHHEKARWLKRYGIHQPTFRDALGEIDPASDIPVAGFCEYLNNVSAAIGLSQFESLESRFQKQYEHGIRYDEELAAIEGVQTLKRMPDTKPSFWVYTFLARDRDNLLRSLRSKDIYASKVHLRNDYYSSFGPKAADLLNTDEFEKEYISVPSGWWLADSDSSRIIESVRAFYKG